MHFTEGKDLEYERLMQQKPGFDRQPNKFAAPRGKRGCPRCLHWDAQAEKCGIVTCLYFPR